MRKRWVLWFPLLAVAGAVGGLTASALAVRPGDARVAVAVERLADIGRHPVPDGVAIGSPVGRPPRAFWLVRDGEDWRAFANQATFWLACPLQFQENADRFMDSCDGGLWDRLGRFVAGRGDRNLDEFPVIAGQAGYVTVDLSRLTPGADSPPAMLRKLVDVSAAGREEAAWLLIHPDRRGAADYPAFLRWLRGAGITRDYAFAHPYPPGSWDDRLRLAGAPGGRTWDNALKVSVRFRGGPWQEWHLVADAGGRWWFVWSPEFGLE